MKHNSSKRRRHTTPPVTTMLLIFMALTALIAVTPATVSAAVDATNGDAHHYGDNTTTTSSSTNNTDTHNNDYDIHEYEEHAHAVTGVVFPWFAEIIGVMVFYLLSRYLDPLFKIPYTAIIFIIGTFMGIGALRLERDDTLTESIVIWSKIDSELLLNIFLPGLIFHDAYSMNIHLFTLSLSQCLIMAFPMVLAGTCLVACVAYYVFPFGWSFFLCLTFGSILSATDPVAVSALLNEVGAPPRLKVHISGESLLNDGAAIVFFYIFSEIYLLELNNPDYGTNIGWGQGVVIFLRMALGGAGIGLLFGLGLLMLLYLLRRRLNEEENVMQIIATITTAYLCFYTAEVVCGTSGVIAVLVCGLLTKEFGSNMINSRQMMESFWLLVENLLNTLLFALGGVVWGGIIANDDERDTDFKGKEWGYLILLYVMLMIIRLFLFYAFFPILSRIGLKTNVKETFFMFFGGLRGAVGIALAISLDNKVFQATEDTIDDDPSESITFRQQTNTLFGMVGGIALMTLVLNGTSAGPILHKLGLAEESETRKKIVAGYNYHFRERVLQSFIHLLCDQRYHHVNFRLIEHHVPYLRGLTIQEFKAAVQRNKESVPALLYQKPFVDDVLHYLKKKEGIVDDDTEIGSDTSHEEQAELEEAALTDVQRRARMRKRRRQKQVSFFKSTMDEFAKGIQTEGGGAVGGQRHRGSVSLFDTAATLEEQNKTEEGVATMKEMRTLYIELLRSAYQTQIDKGELDSRNSFSAYILLESLEFATDKITKGEPIGDFEQVKVLWSSWKESGDRLLKNFYKDTKQDLQKRASRMNIYNMSPAEEQLDTRAKSRKFKTLRVRVPIVVSFLDAHVTAQKAMREEFSKPPFDVNGKIVAMESKEQVRLAMDFLESENEEDVKMIISHLMCIILLNKFARYIESVTHKGFLKEKEAAEYIEEIEEHLEEINRCTKDECEGHISLDPTGSVLDAVHQASAEMMAPAWTDHGEGDVGETNVEVTGATGVGGTGLRKRPHPRLHHGVHYGASIRHSLQLSDLPPEFLNGSNPDDNINNTASPESGRRGGGAAEPLPPPPSTSPSLSILDFPITEVPEDVSGTIPPVDERLGKLPRSGKHH